VQCICSHVLQATGAVAGLQPDQRCAAHTLFHTELFLGVATAQNYGAPTVLPVTAGGTLRASSRASAYTPPHSPMQGGLLAPLQRFPAHQRFCQAPAGQPAVRYPRTQFLVAYSSCKLVYMLPVMHVPGP